MRAEVYAASQSQKGRQNEDSYLIGRGAFPMCALADGAGHAERAAKRAITLFEKLHADAEQRNPQELLEQKTWKNWVSLMDSALLGGPQSTFCAFNVGGLSASKTVATGVCSGDSRFYLLNGSNGNLIHLTESAQKSRLGSGKVQPMTFHVELRSGDLLLLLSDGAWTPMSPDDLRRTVLAAKTKHLSEVPVAIIERAGKHGGLADDATAVVMRCA